MALSVRFFQGFPWRFILTTLDTETVTSLERLASNRTVTFRLNQPAESRGQVPSWEPRINITDVEPGLDAPHLSFDDRLMYGFRREARNPDVWVVRFAGICTQLEDVAQTDNAVSNYTAFDPWQYLYHRKLWDGTGTVGEDGLEFSGVTGNEVVATILDAAIAGDGPAFIEYDAGTWDTTDTIEITFQQGTSVGDALRQLVQLGGMDIVFTPVYDPVTKPGVCCSVSVFTEAGTVQDGAVFSWDVGRSLTGISNLLDGDQLANEVLFHNGQGGPLVSPSSEDATSQSRYGVYTAEQFFPAQRDEQPVVAMADFQLSIRNQGRRTVSINPNPLLSPKPFLDYTLGDRVPVYATTNLRQAIPWGNAPTVYQRVYGIPITLGDDGVETVRQLVASPDGFA